MPGPAEVNWKIREPQRLGHQIVGQDLRAEMLAAPRELAQRGEHLEMRRGPDRALQQASAVQPDAGRFGDRRHLAQV